jgi:hypothetical protein
MLLLSMIGLASASGLTKNVASLRSPSSMRFAEIGADFFRVQLKIKKVINSYQKKYVIY